MLCVRGVKGHAKINKRSICLEMFHDYQIWSEESLTRVLCIPAVTLQAGGRGQGAECPPETSDRKISADLPGNREKRGKERRKNVKLKVEN